MIHQLKKMDNTDDSTQEAVTMLRWFEEGGNNSDVVISSRVRLARNINGYNFSYKMSDTDAKSW